MNRARKTQQAMIKEADAYLSKVCLAHEGGEEGVGVTDAIGRDGRCISAEAIPPVVSQATLTSSLNEEQHIGVDCINGVHCCQIQVTRTYTMHTLAALHTLLQPIAQQANVASMHRCV